MEQIHKDLLLEKRMELKNAIFISVTEVTNYLQSKGIMSLDMCQNILCDGTPPDKVYRLLDMLPTRGSRAFQIFYDAMCHCQLWDAADILKPDKAPHETSVDSMVPAPCQSQQYAGQCYMQSSNNVQMDENHFQQIMQALDQPSLTQVTDPGLQMEVARLLNGSDNYIRANTQRCPPRRGPLQSQQTFQYLCLDPNSVSSLDNTYCDSPENILKCQHLISEFKVPLNINDLITLAALEWKANLDDRKAHNIIKCMASKAKKYFDAKVSELTDDGHMTATKARRTYVSMSQPKNYKLPFTDCRFFQVWVLFHEVLEGPNILAINSQWIMFWDIGTKKPKAEYMWPFNSLTRCKISSDDAFTVILDFENKTRLTLLSLEFEEINKVFNS